MPRKNPKQNHIRVRSYVKESGVRVRRHNRKKSFGMNFEKETFRTSDIEQRAITLLRHNKELAMQSGAINVLGASGIPSMYANDKVLRGAGFSSTEIQHIRKIER